MKPIYLDYNATTPVDPRVADAMLPYLKDHFGNPSSSHEFGVITKQAVETAREQISKLLGCAPGEIIFTSSGSESNNFAIKGIAGARRDQGSHLITSSVEHPAVLEVCRYLEGRGFALTLLPVDAFGQVTPADVEQAITPETLLISVMHANNEVGTIQPIREISDIAHRHGVLVHSDCAQSIGKVPVDVNELGVDLLSVAGHKLYAPKGVGALYVRSGLNLEKLIHGAGHELNRRAGTENVLGIVGLGKAAELITNETAGAHARVKKLRDDLERNLLEHIPGIRINGHPEQRLPNTLSVSFPGMKANELLGKLTTVAASAGAACHNNDIKVSAVLKAMGVPLEFAMGTLRFSVGRFTTAEDIRRASDEIVAAVNNGKV
ncbi:MAG: cysteine desulfurase [FCB group bacterium]|nr:cysteine desulfurase [FCB group bacterium]